MYTVEFTLARRSSTSFATEEEARAYAQRKANSLKTAATITFTDHEGRREFVTIIKPEKQPRNLAIYTHMEHCLAEGMSVQEASNAWARGDYH